MEIKNEIQKFYKNGVELEKGVHLTIDRINKNLN